MRPTAHHLLVPVALAAACALATPASAAGSRTFDVTVPLTCNLQARDDSGVQFPIPMSVRLAGSTDEYAPAGTTVSFSDLETSIVFPPAAKAVLETFGADTIGGKFYGLDLLSDGDPFFASIITSNEDKSVPFPATLLSGTGPTTIPLTGPDINSSVGPIGVTSRGTVSVFTAGAYVALSTGGTPSGINLNGPDAYDLNCFDNDYSTVVATYPPSAPVASLPVVSSVTGRAIPRLGGVAVVRGTRLGGTTGVTVGGTRASFLQLSATQVLIFAPPQPRGTYDVIVTTRSGASAPSPTSTLTYGRG